MFFLWPYGRKAFVLYDSESTGCGRHFLRKKEERRHFSRDARCPGIGYMAFPLTCIPKKREVGFKVFNDEVFGREERLAAIFLRFSAVHACREGDTDRSILRSRRNFICSTRK